MSLEIVGFAQGVHFYIRVPKKYRKLVESAFFSQYPDAEIEEAQDYISFLPPDLPNHEFDIWGTDYVLARDNAYPLKTYPYFEQILQFEELSIDPLATITEVISNLENNELVWLQLLIRPIGSEWTSRAKGVVDELTGKGGGKSIMDSLIEFGRNLMKAPISHPEWSGSEGAPSPPERLTPGK